MSDLAIEVIRLRLTVTVNATDGEAEFGGAIDAAVRERIVLEPGDVLHLDVAAKSVDLERRPPPAAPPGTPRH